MQINEFKIITKEDLATLNLSSYIKDLIFKDLNLDNMSLSELVKLINKLALLIKQVMIPVSNGKYSYSYKNIRKKNFQQIILLSGFLEFRIRQFLLQETIYYSLGATNKQGQLFERRLSQDELWSSMSNNNKLLIRSSLSSKAIKISKTLENIKTNEESFIKVGSLNLWPTLMKLAFINNADIYEEENSEEINDTTENLYHKFSPDNNVYFRYKAGKKQLKSYYYKKQGEYFFYNQGWLYEWYLTYINMSEEHERYLQKSLKHNTFSPIVYGMDTVEGIKAGDFTDINQNQVQAKFNNQQIISFHNILTVLLDLQKDLMLLQNTPQDISNIAKKIESIFISDELAQKMNSTYSTTIMQQLNLLLQK